MSGGGGGSKSRPTLLPPRGGYESRRPVARVALSPYRSPRPYSGWSRNEGSAPYPPPRCCSRSLCQPWDCTGVFPYRLSREGERAGEEPRPRGGDRLLGGGEESLRPGGSSPGCRPRPPSSGQPRRSGERPRLADRGGDLSYWPPRLRSGLRRSRSRAQSPRREIGDLERDRRGKPPRPRGGRSGLSRRFRNGSANSTSIWSAMLRSRTLRSLFKALSATSGVSNSTTTSEPLRMNVRHITFPYRLHTPWTAWSSIGRRKPPNHSADDGVAWKSSQGKVWHGEGGDECAW